MLRFLAARFRLAAPDGLLPFRDLAVPGSRAVTTLGDATEVRRGDKVYVVLPKSTAIALNKLELFIIFPFSLLLTSIADCFTLLMLMWTDHCPILNLF